MFYSHEILTNNKSGVATVWLVATVGSSGAQKRLSRKDIQEVNVPKACEAIIDPGAPLALRLQGNLLYGISRVFAQQCRFVLLDAAKAQSDMMAFFEESKTDPDAGQAKRHQITLEDDPNFDPWDDLPYLDCSVDEPGQLSPENDVSEITPLTQVTDSSVMDHLRLDFDIPMLSASPPGSRGLPSGINLEEESPPFASLFDLADPFAEFNPFGGQFPEPAPGIQIEFDIDGNLIGFTEPELPALPGPAPVMAQFCDRAARIPGVGLDKGQFGGDNFVIMGEEALLDADIFSSHASAKKPTSSAAPTSESSEAEQGKAPARRGRPRKLNPIIDVQDYIPSALLQNWSGDYLDNMEEASHKSSPTSTPPSSPTRAQWKRMFRLLGSGLAEIGKPPSDVVEPLAKEFSGINLVAHLQGRELEQEKLESEARGLRRNSADAFEDGQDNEERRVRQKMDDNADLARGLEDGDGAVIFGDDMAPEMGMEAAPALDDRHSSSMPPWSRAPSVVPGSSIQGHGSAQKRLPAPSPLHARGSAVRAIERWSDLPGLPYGSDGLQRQYSQDSSIEQEGFIDDFGLHGGNDTQRSTRGTDGSALDFLGYATAQAQIKGHVRPRDRTDRRWIDFETLTDEVEEEEPANQRKFISEAFMHVLTLATMNAMAVEQDGLAEKQPFGTIHVGLTVPQQDDDEMGVGLTIPQQDDEMGVGLTIPQQDDEMDVDLTVPQKDDDEMGDMMGDELA